MDGVVIVDGAPARCLGLKIRWSRLVMCYNGSRHFGRRVRADGVIDAKRRLNLMTSAQAELTHRCYERWLRAGAPGLRISYSPSVAPIRWTIGPLSLAGAAGSLWVWAPALFHVFDTTFWLDLASFSVLLVAMFMPVALAVLVGWWAWRLDATVRRVTITDAGGSVQHDDGKTIDWRWSDIESLRKGAECFLVRMTDGRAIQLPVPPQPVQAILSNRQPREEPKPDVTRWSVVRQWCYAGFVFIATAAIVWWSEGSWSWALLAAGIAAGFFVALAIAAHVELKRSTQARASSCSRPR